MHVSHPSSWPCTRPKMAKISNVHSMPPHRHGPGVPDFSLCEAWAALAVVFVQAARRAETIVDVLGFGIHITGLKQSVYAGLENNGEQVQLMEDLFDKRPVLLRCPPIGHLSALRALESWRRTIKCTSWWRNTKDFSRKVMFSCMISILNNSDNRFTLPYFISPYKNLR